MASYYRTEPNWDNAPHEATHWAPENDFFSAAWYRKFGDSWSSVNDHGTRLTNRTDLGWYGHGTEFRRGEENLIERPQ